MSSQRSFRSVQSLKRVPLFETPRTAACQASLSFSISLSLLKPMSTELVMPSNHLFLCRPLLLLCQYFPASGSLPMSQLFTSGGQNIGVSVSTSVFPMNTQDWYLLRWIGWIAFQSKELSRVFSNTTVQKDQFLALSFFILQLSIHTWPLEIL